MDRPGYRSSSGTQERFLLPMYSYCGRTSPSSDEFIDDEEGHIVAVGHTRGVVRATGREFEVPAVHVWTIREGKAVKFEAYVDTFQMRVALGLA